MASSSVMDVVFGAAVLLREIECTLAELGVSRSGSESVLVACSGGLDSVVLAHATTELLGARRVTLGHVDHGVRPGSDADLRFVEALAVAWGADFISAHLKPERDDEAMLRNLRYEALLSMSVEADVPFILCAHTQDDQAETVLMRLLCSAGFQSLAGIPARRARIVRPLLSVPRSTLRAYAERRGLRWREDPTNREPRYLRNRIRKELLPLLEKRYRPGIRRRLAAMADSIRFATEDASAEPTAALTPSVQLRYESRGLRSKPDGQTSVAFDALSIGYPLVGVLRQDATIQPVGCPERRSVFECLESAGVRGSQRFRWPIVLDEKGTVLWIPGVLRSAHAPVSLETTQVWLFSTGDIDKLLGKVTCPTRESLTDLTLSAKLPMDRKEKREI